MLDSDSRFLDGTEFYGQKAAEYNNGDCLGLEWPANVANFLHEFHETFWQSDIGRPLWWNVRDLIKGAETRRTPRILRRASYLSLASVGKFGCVLFTFKTFISLSNVKLDISPEISIKELHTPKQPPKQASTSGDSELRYQWSPPSLSPLHPRSAYKSEL